MIACRDDIMVYLIQMGLEPDHAFKIMESVRKGIVAKGKCDKWEEWKQEMLDHGVPDWYIWSCELIKYMFPKAHAVAYVTMAWRIAYCKLYYPLAYYASYFSIRAKDFSYEIMCQGKNHCDAKLDEYIRIVKAGKGGGSDDDDDEEGGGGSGNKEKGILRDLRLVQEMYARGFDFEPIDIYRAKSRQFQIVDDKRLMPSLCSIDGLGEKAADAIQEAASKGPFLSKDDLRDRAKIGKSTIELLDRLHLLDGLPDSNQISIFDFVSGGN